MNEEPVGLLVSQAVHDELGDRLNALARASGHTLRVVVSPARPGQPISAEAQASVRLAYYSRDIMQGSSKGSPSPAAALSSISWTPRRAPNGCMSAPPAPIITCTSPRCGAPCA
jgi:hypothetical protein